MDRPVNNPPTPSTPGVCLPLCEAPMKEKRRLDQGNAVALQTPAKTVAPSQAENIHGLPTPPLTAPHLATKGRARMRSPSLKKAAHSVKSAVHKASLRGKSTGKIPVFVPPFKVPERRIDHNGDDIPFDEGERSLLTIAAYGFLSGKRNRDHTEWV
ncbi:hypothetical protein VNI00_017564 [Paramarasmius palmivorus]|uniref:Uncharacterized protein n=1 Tax=Paramarasmius palmivorus TaxID=297713 RepID=A0AAW0B4R7_9AGAR